MKLDCEKELDLFLESLTENKLKKALKDLILYTYETVDLNILLDINKKIQIYWESCGELLVPEDK